MQTFTIPSTYDMYMYLTSAFEATGLYSIATNIVILTAVGLAFMLRKYSLWAKIPAFIYALVGCFWMMVIGMNEKFFLDDYWLGVARAQNAGETLSATVQQGLTQSGITEQMIITPNLFANPGRIVISMLTIAIVSVVLFSNKRPSFSIYATTICQANTISIYMAYHRYSIAFVEVCSHRLTAVFCLTHARTVICPSHTSQPFRTPKLGTDTFTFVLSEGASV